MKQYNILGGIDEMSKQHPQLENTIIKNEAKYYGSDLNKFVAENCRKDMVVNNIDLIINDYKNNKIRIIESKHSTEKMSKGQELLLKKLSQIGIDTYTIYGDEPYNEAILFSFQNEKSIKLNKEELILFLNNQLYFCENCNKSMIEKKDCCSYECSKTIINKYL